MSASVGQADSVARVAPDANRIPRAHWSAGPAGTRSHALLVVDNDVPTDVAIFNRPQSTIRPGARRVAVRHGVVIYIPASTLALPTGANGEGHRDGGKSVGSISYGRRGRHGVASFLKGGSYDDDDEPCPSWNDARIHLGSPVFGGERD